MQPGCAGSLGVTLHLCTSTSMLTTTETTHAVGHTAFNANGIKQVCVVLGVFAVLFMYEQDVKFTFCDLKLIGFFSFFFMCTLVRLNICPIVSWLILNNHILQCFYIHVQGGI